MISSFYPGPSKIYPQVAQFMQEALESGILSMNHRSSVFMEMCHATIEAFMQKQSVPKDYRAVFTSSATECWEIIAQSLMPSHLNSLHIYNGSFGEKWADYTEKLGSSPQSSVHRVAFDLEKKPDLEATEGFFKHKNSIICLTHNETSNGTILSDSFMEEVRQRFPAQLIAIDATSSLGGLALDYTLGDIWFASVQKCLGLPSGMAVMLCSPKAVERVYALNERKHYNSLPFLLDNFRNFQTPYTPNILNIFLLGKVMKMVEPIEKIHLRLQQQAIDLYHLIENHEDFECLVKQPAMRSETVICVAGKAQKIHFLKQEARKQNIILGNGYGRWKNDTFRIANFPAISPAEIAQLSAILRLIS